MLHKLGQVLCVALIFTVFFPLGFEHVLLGQVRAEDSVIGIRVVDQQGNPIQSAKIRLDEAGGVPLAKRKKGRKENPSRKERSSIQGQTDENGLFFKGFAVPSITAMLRDTNVEGTIIACGSVHEFKIASNGGTNITTQVNPVAWYIDFFMIPTSVEDAIKTILEEILDQILGFVPEGIVSTENIGFFIADRIEIDCPNNRPNHARARTANYQLSSWNRFVEPGLRNDREYVYRLTNQSNTGIDSFSLCFPDNVDPRDVVLTEGEEGQVGNSNDDLHQNGGLMTIPDGWGWFFATSNDGEEDEDCITFFTPGSSYRPIQPGQSKEFKILSDNPNAGSVGIIEAFPTTRQRPAPDFDKVNTLGPVKD